MTLIVLICFAHWTAFDLSVPGNTSPLFPWASHLGKQIRKPEYPLLWYQWESKAGKPLASNGGNSGTSPFPTQGTTPSDLLPLLSQAILNSLLSADTSDTWIISLSYSLYMHVKSLVSTSQLHWGWAPSPSENDHNIYIKQNIPLVGYSSAHLEMYIESGVHHHSFIQNCSITTKTPWCHTFLFQAAPL